jgi:hypothetical protein
MPFHAGPVPRQHSPARIVDFHLPRACHPGALKAEVEATHA